MYRDYQPPIVGTRARQASLEEQWSNFNLVREANSGDSRAQHELALRYIFGRGFPVDTAKCVYWLQRAVALNLPEAHYNFGLFQNNGWGIPWNPFEAYLHFTYAAEHDVPEGAYMLGIMHTDNLVVARSWKEAFRWLKKAVKLGFEPAKSARDELLKRGYVTAADTLDEVGQPTSQADAQAEKSPKVTQSKANTLSPVFLDFSRDTTPGKPVEGTVLRDEFLGSKTFSRADSSRIMYAPVSGTVTDTSLRSMLFEAARWCNPEAATLIGYCYEQGYFGKVDRVSATLWYTRAIYYDSPRAPALLYTLVTKTDVTKEIQKEALRNDPKAQFLLAELSKLEFDRQLSLYDGLELQRKAAAQKNIDALIHFGIWYSSGKWVRQDLVKAAGFWQEAADLGSDEARLRLAAAQVLGDASGPDLKASFALLEQASEQGSILARVALAYSAETGSGRTKSMSDAVSEYRASAQRGSRHAYRSLQRIYNSMRPNNDMFIVKED